MRFREKNAYGRAKVIIQWFFIVYIFISAENGSTKNGDSKNGEGDRKRKTDDDIEIVEEAVPAKKDGDSKNGEGDRKRKTDDDVEIAEEAVPAKKAKTAAATAAEDDDIICLE